MVVPCPFGSKAPAVLQKVMAQPSHTFSHEHAVVAGTVGGRCRFRQGLPATGRPSGELAIATGCRVREPAGGQPRSALPVVGFGRHDPGGRGDCASPAGRGSGTGSALFSDAFRAARAAKSRTLTLDVDTANTRAIDLYLRLGLRVAATSRRAVPFGGTRVSRMAAPVSDAPDPSRIRKPTEESVPVVVPAGPMVRRRRQRRNAIALRMKPASVTGTHMTVSRP